MQTFEVVANRGRLYEVTVSADGKKIVAVDSKIASYTGKSKFYLRRLWRAGEPIGTSAHCAMNAYRNMKRDQDAANQAANRSI